MDKIVAFVAFLYLVCGRMGFCPALECMRLHTPVKRADAGVMLGQLRMVTVHLRLRLRRSLRDHLDAVTEVAYVGVCTREAVWMFKVYCLRLMVPHLHGAVQAAAMSLHRSFVRLVQRRLVLETATRGMLVICACFREVAAAVGSDRVDIKARVTPRAVWRAGSARK